jgi:hypothetical protein
MYDILWLIAALAVCALSAKRATRCAHANMTRPWRDEDGVDYWTCTQCSEKLVSPVQFGKALTSK